MIRQYGMLATVECSGVPDASDMHDPIQGLAVSHRCLWGLRPNVHGDEVDISSNLDIRVHKGTFKGIMEGSIRGVTPDCCGDDILLGGASSSAQTTSKCTS